jgi:hypothetical protein
MKNIYLLAFVGGIMYNALSTEISLVAYLVALVGLLSFLLKEHPQDGSDN